MCTLSDFLSFAEGDGGDAEAEPFKGRLLSWMVDGASGQPLSTVCYCVSESFLVSDHGDDACLSEVVPGVHDPVSRLVHIGANGGRAAKLQDTAKLQEIGAAELGIISTVGRFKQLVQRCEADPAGGLGRHIQDMLEMTREEWTEVCQHALRAVDPDIKDRAWRCPETGRGLLFNADQGAICLNAPAAVLPAVYGDTELTSITPIGEVPLAVVGAVPELKQKALEQWYQLGHPGWEIVAGSEVCPPTP